MKEYIKPKSLGPSDALEICLCGMSGNIKKELEGDDRCRHKNQLTIGRSLCEPYLKPSPRWESLSSLRWEDYGVLSTPRGTRRAG